MKQRTIVILGSTGSIGTQALDVVRQHQDLFDVYAITANNNIDLLEQQAREFNPKAVVIANEDKYEELQNRLADTLITVYTGEDALCEIVEAGPVDMVLAAMVGFAGLRPTLRAIKAKKAIALANKETLVVAGQIITNLAQEYKVPILPVDSEHSAIFQCLAGETYNKIEKIILTASGGPFKDFTSEQLREVTTTQALKHPNWKMGAKITIDSATMMNKGFEVIEAKWLFGTDAKNIQVVVHPESVVHSAVQFEDGSIKAQLGMPDMRLPIQYAFCYPQRPHLESQRLDLIKMGQLNFKAPDLQKFPCLQLAYEAINQGGNVPCIVNAANEIANQAFRDERIKFYHIPILIEKMIEKTVFLKNPSIEDLFNTDAEVRQRCKDYIINELS